MMYTHTGRTIDVGNLRSRDVDLEDIGHALACLNRYQGHAPRPYSVAQHSVLAAKFAPAGFELEALLHDAHEAFVGDIPRPLKRLLPDHSALEARVAATVRRAFDLPAALSPEVESIDTRLLVTEARSFGMPWWTEIGATPLPGLEVRPWPWHKAKVRFLGLAQSLLEARCAGR